MIFSDINWIRAHFHKLDKLLRRELLSYYKNVRFIPAFLQGFIRSFRFSFKKVNVIVRHRDSLSTDEHKNMLNVLGMKEGKNCSKLCMLNCYSMKLSPNKLNKLLEMNAIKSVYLDREVKALLDKAGPSINVSAAWDQKRSGKGITTAVIDTGIYPHADLVKPVNRIIGFKDFVNKKTKPYDDNGHGTHVAGIIASDGASSKGLYRAPAYQSSLVGVKVLDKYGSGSLSTILSAIEWCINNKSKYNIKIINLSLGSKASTSYKDDLLCEAVEAAWNAGIVVCAAAGNEGPNSRTISSPGIDPLIITVGAVDDKNTSSRRNDKIASFSSRGPTIDGLNKPDVVSPGVNIISLRVPSSYLDKQMSNSRVGEYYFSLSGTSMATPICCSSIAIILEKNPNLSPQQIKDILTKSSQNMGYDINTQGAGYIDIKKAIT